MSKHGRKHTEFFGDDRKGTTWLVQIFYKTENQGFKFTAQTGFGDWKESGASYTHDGAVLAAVNECGLNLETVEYPA